MRRRHVHDDGHEDDHAMNQQQHRTRGQALVEFALVLPIFLIILFGIIDFGRYVYTANAISNGTREGARAGSVGVRPSPLCDGLGREACIDAVVKANSWGLVDDDISIDSFCERPIGNTSGNPTVDNCKARDGLRVQAEVDFFLLTPLIAQFIGDVQVAGETRVTIQSSQ
jgi:hypothetical protein